MRRGRVIHNALPLPPIYNTQTLFLFLLQPFFLLPMELVAPSTENFLLANTAHNILAPCNKFKLVLSSAPKTPREGTLLGGVDAL